MSVEEGLGKYIDGYIDLLTDRYVCTNAYCIWLFLIVKIKWK